MEPDYHRPELDSRNTSPTPDVAVEPFEDGFLVVIQRTTGIRCEYYCRTEFEAREIAGAARAHES
jgi:hypothetical protein